MKVALAHAALKGNGLGGGISRLYIELGKQLTNLGCDITFISGDKTFNPSWAKTKHIAYSHSHPELFRQQLTIFLSSQVFDIIECSNYGFEALEYAKTLNHKPVVVRGDISAREFSENTLVKFEKRLMELAQANVAISFSAKAYFEKHYDIRISQTIWNGVNVEHFPPIERYKNNHNIVWVGVPEYVKGFDILNKVARYLPDFNFQVVLGIGEGQGKINLRNVQIHGNITTSELNKLYQEATYILCTSRYEPFGLPLLEGMSTGLIPLIPEKCGGPAEYIIDGYNGLTFTNKEDLGSKLMRLSNFRELSSNAIATSKELSWQRCALETLTVYKSLATI
jgi:glycosyltransferase involved in cell wall biosynthesis